MCSASSSKQATSEDAGRVRDRQGRLRLSQVGHVRRPADLRLRAQDHRVPGLLRLLHAAVPDARALPGPGLLTKGLFSRGAADLEIAVTQSAARGPYFLNKYLRLD